MTHAGDAPHSTRPLPQARTGGIDLHTHLAPTLGQTKPYPHGVVTEDGRLLIDGKRIGPDSLYRPQSLIDYLDQAELDTAIVTLPPPFYRQHLPKQQAAQWVRAVNDGMLATVEAQPRLRALAYLPLEHPDVAILEYERIRTTNTWAGLTACAGGASASQADPALAPLWSALDADARLLALHPGRSTDPRLDVYYLHNLLGNPIETAIAAAQLVFGGVLAAHPAMRVLLMHCGGAVPAVVGRWQRGTETSRPGVPHDIEPPARACRRLYVDCLAYDPAVLRLAVDVFGADRIVVGSDWPFPMHSSTPRDLLSQACDEPFVHRAAIDNALAALGDTREQPSRIRHEPPAQRR